MIIKIILIMDRIKWLYVAFFLLILQTNASAEGRESPLRFLRITHSLYYKSSLTIGREGRFLAYSAFKDGRQRIRVRSLETGEEFEVPIDIEAISPSFSPDGKRLVFHSFIEKEPQLHIVNIDGEDLRRLEQRGYNASWSPKGDKIAFIHQSHIGIINPDHKGVRFFTTGKHNDYPDFSFDGKRIVFYSEGKIKMIEVEPIEETIMVEKKEPKVIVKRHWNGYPTLSPDGKKLALISTRRKEDPKGERNYNLWIFNLQTKEWLQITDDPGMEYSPRWLPNSDGIVFIKQEKGAFDIWKVEGIKNLMGN